VIAHLKRDYSFKILYISCNPVTMARDIWLFAERGIIVRQLKAVDMFPHTHHIECIGVLR
jgi:23S rRNA (uracil1939-C5)-methyltransferase